MPDNALRAEITPWLLLKYTKYKGDISEAVTWVKSLPEGPLKAAGRKALTDPEVVSDEKLEQVRKLMP